MTLFLRGHAVSGDPLFRRRSRIAHERALAQSERYRYLDAKKHRTADEFFEYLSLPREITPPTALMRLYWWWEHQPFLSAPVATVRSYVQRARRGWSTGDTWTLSPIWVR